MFRKATRCTMIDSTHNMETQANTFFTVVLAGDSAEEVRKVGALVRGHQVLVRVGRAAVVGAVVSAHGSTIKMRNERRR